MIPKIIHQVWVGPARYPAKYTEPWDIFAEQYGWEHKVWRDKDLDEFPWRNAELYDYYRTNHIWHSVADLARAEILSKYGGFYFDCDMVWSGQPWHETLINPYKHDFIVTTEHFFPPEKNWHGLKWYEDLDYQESALFVCYGFIGSAPHHPILEKHLKVVDSHVKTNNWATGAEGVGCYLLSRCITAAPFTLIPMRYIFPAVHTKEYICKYHNTSKLAYDIEDGLSTENPGIWQQ